MKKGRDQTEVSVLAWRPLERVDCIQPETSGWVNLNSFIHLFDKIGERFNGPTLRQYSASRGYIFAL